MEGCKAKVRRGVAIVSATATLPGRSMVDDRLTTDQALTSEDLRRGVFSIEAARWFRGAVWRALPCLR
jgi:hypothetical protein